MQRRISIPLCETCMYNYASYCVLQVDNKTANCKAYKQQNVFWLYHKHLNKQIFYVQLGGRGLGQKHQFEEFLRKGYNVHRVTDPYGRTHVQIDEKGDPNDEA